MLLHSGQEIFQNRAENPLKISYLFQEILYRAVKYEATHVFVEQMYRPRLCVSKALPSIWTRGASVSSEALSW